MGENEIEIGRLEKENSAEEERLPRTDITSSFNDPEDDVFPEEEESPVEENRGIKMIGPDFISGMIDRVKTETSFCAFNLGQVTAQASDVEERMNAIATSEVILTALDICGICFQTIYDGLMNGSIGDKSYGIPSSIPAESLSILPSVLSNTISWKPSGPLMGTDDEWVDISDNGQYKDLIGKIWWLTSDHLDGTGIMIESVQYNKRCKFVRRFNEDNRLAHRVDGQKFIDKDTEEEISPFAIHGSTIRFIEFPYIYTEPNLLVVDTNIGKVVDVITPSNIGVNSLPCPRFIQEIIDASRLVDVADLKYDESDASGSVISALPTNLREQIEQILSESDDDDDSDEAESE